MEALPLTRACAREPAQEQRFGQQVLAAKTSRLLQHGWEILYLAFVALAFGLGTAGILWVGSLQVRAGRLTIGELLVFLAYLAQLHEPLNQLSHVGVTLSDATAGTQRVLEILDTPEDVRDKPGARPVVKAVSPALATTRTPQPLVIQGVLEFDGVTFGYESGRPVLQAVSFTLAAGESAALLGPSGAGKTTLLQLLPRFYDPLAGRVKLDGTDLCDLRLSELRRQIAFVMQEPILLPGTIAENIAFARPEASTEAIRAAALAAHADEFISRLPNGYETVVGEGAARLSAGEKQRLSLARAFLQDAPMLVLDEPTSSLDAQSEDLVLAGLAKLMRGRTTLWATHRPQALRLVERVLVLERGRLIEEGKPAQLAQRPGSYCLRLLQQAGREHSSYV
jgi:ATP-binding cassette subfamily B protein/subfamily B ATP-binding cassette protein MsbA